MALETGDDLATLYQQRFEHQGEARDDIWSVLCTEFFQSWVPRDAVVVDVAAGHCEFINNIEAGRRIAVDLNPDVAKRARGDVEARVGTSDDLPCEDASVDRVFISNLLEHLTRDQILATLTEVRRVLRPGGKLLILQPNIRFCPKDYWMFFDHITPIDDRALVEALGMTGYDVEKVIERFLPYTTKSRLPTGAGLIRLYLKVPLAWRVLGAQSFVVATPT